jgi:hypothetical protein
MALFAIESSRPADSRLFHDPLAVAFLDRRLRLAAVTARLPSLGRLVPWYIDRRWPGPRPSGVVRTRAVDDAVPEALVGGCAQLVILGTGHDTRAYRAKPGFLLWRATLSWQRRIRSALAPHDLTHVQFVLLASLWWLEDHEPEPPTQASLAAQAETDRMMTSQVLRKLEARDLLERIPDPTTTGRDGFASRRPAANW